MEGMSRNAFEAVNDSRDRVASWPNTWFLKAAGSSLPTGPSPAAPKLENDKRPSKHITDMIATGRFISQGSLAMISTYKTQYPGVKIPRRHYLSFQGRETSALDRSIQRERSC